MVYPAIDLANGSKRHRAIVYLAENKQPKRPLYRVGSVANRKCRQEFFHEPVDLRLGQVVIAFAARSREAINGFATSRIDDVNYQHYMTFAFRLILLECLFFVCNRLQRQAFGLFDTEHELHVQVRVRICFP